MNKIIQIILVAASVLLIALAINCRAQSTNSAPSFTAGLDEMANAVSSSTNWTILGGAGRATKGDRDLAFGAVAYNFNQNVGIVVGEDVLWAPHQSQAEQVNVVKGGVTLSAPIHPFAFIGSTFATNVVGTPFVAALVAQPSGGSKDPIATITTAGIDFDIVSFKNFELVAGAQYETRTGSGFWDGNYAIIHLGISRRF